MCFPKSKKSRSWISRRFPRSPVQPFLHFGYACRNPDMRERDIRNGKSEVAWFSLNFFPLNSNPLLTGAAAAQDQPLIVISRFQTKIEFRRLDTERRLDEPTCAREKDMLIVCGYNPRYIWINLTITIFRFERGRICRHVTAIQTYFQANPEANL